MLMVKRLHNDVSEVPLSSSRADLGFRYVAVISKTGPSTAQDNVNDARLVVVVPCRGGRTCR